MYNKWDIYKLSLFLINKLIAFMYILINVSFIMQLAYIFCIKVLK